MSQISEVKAGNRSATPVCAEKIHIAPSKFRQAFVDFSNSIAQASGSPFSFISAVSVIAVWAITGPVFQFSDTWQLVINTGTTIVTFLMVFTIQNTQNRDNLAIQAKLDELVRALESANNKFVGIERLSGPELEELREECEQEARQELENPPKSARPVHLSKRD